MNKKEQKNIKNKVWWMWFLIYYEENVEGKKISNKKTRYEIKIF